MSRLLFSTLLLVQTAASAATLRGTVRGPSQGGEVLALVEVAPLAFPWSMLERTQVQQGRFALQLSAPGAYSIRVTSPWLAPAHFPLWVGKDSESIDVAVTLGPDQVLPARGAPLVRGEWSDFKSAEPMDAAADGTFLLRGSSTAPHVRYYIERDTALGPDREPNPAEPRVEVMEHRFTSVADVRDGGFEITHPSSCGW